MPNRKQRRTAKKEAAKAAKAEAKAWKMIEEGAAMAKILGVISESSGSSGARTPGVSESRSWDVGAMLVQCTDGPLYVGAEQLGKLLSEGKVAFVGEPDLGKLV